MSSRDFYLRNIEKECAAAGQAAAEGNDGRARVCARRAAGHALAWYLSKYPRPEWGKDALSQLKHLKDDPGFPPSCRDAAARLTTRISTDFTYPFSTNPLDDAGIVIRTVQQRMEPDVA